MRHCFQLIAAQLSAIVLLTGALPVCAKDSQWQRRLNEGVQAQTGGNYAQADSDLQEALRLTAKFQSNDPRLAQTYYQVAQLRLNEEQWSDAQEYFARALKIQEKLSDPESIEIGNTLSGLATATEQLGNHQMAVLLLKRVRSIWVKHYGAHDSRLTTVLPAMAIYAMLDSDYATAQECYKQLIAVQEQVGGSNSIGLGSALDSYASCLAYLGKFAEAEPFAQRAVNVLTAAGDTPTAIDGATTNLQYIEQQLNKAAPPLTSHPAESPTASMTVSAHIVSNTTIEPTAIASITKPAAIAALTKAPTTPTQSSAATALPSPSTANHQSENSGKIQYLAGGRLITPEQYKAMTLANNAYELIREQKYPMAVKVLKSALAIYPDLSSAHSNLGLALSELGQNDDAIAHLRKAIALDATRPAAWANLAGALQMSGQLKEAVTTYGEFIQRFPNQPLVAKAQAIKSQLETELNEQAQAEQTGSGASSADYLCFASRQGTLRWPANTIKVYIASGADTSSFKPEYAGLLTDAFKQWQTASQQKLHFEFVTSVDSANIQCLWTEDTGKVSSPLEGGETSLSHGATNIEHATITILTKGQTADTPLSTDQVRAVCLHEVGHALGLAGHSPKPQDIMYCSVPPATVKAEISSRDTATIQKLYSDKQTVSWTAW